MKHDIELQIRSLVAILRQNNIKVWVDFKSMNRSKLSGVYGELCERIRKHNEEKALILDNVQLKWLTTMKVLPNSALWETTTTLREDIEAGRKYCENA